MSYLDVLLIIFPFKPCLPVFHRRVHDHFYLVEIELRLQYTALQVFHEEHICHTLYNFKPLPPSEFFLGHNFMVQRS